VPREAASEKPGEHGDWAPVRENDSMLSAHASLTAAALGDELTENEASVRVFLTAGGLAILGCALLLFTIWWWRGTKPESPALGPLEVMSDRRWHTASENERRRLVEQHRPDAAARLNGVVAPVPIDLSVLARNPPSSFDDLRDEPNRWPYGPAESSPSADGSVLGAGGLLADEADQSGPEADETVPAETPDADLALLDATMYQVELPALPELSNGLSHHDDEPEYEQLDLDGIDDLDEPSGEMVIDPLLQRTALQD
jgi:hypothetical protein